MAGVRAMTACACIAVAMADGVIWRRVKRAGRFSARTVNLICGGRCRDASKYRYVALDKSGFGMRW